MARNRIDYGIDLGTTNSAIARMESGEAKILKSDGMSKDTTPSCVSFRKGTTLVGDKAYSRKSDEHKEAFKDFSKTGNTSTAFNTFGEFKRTMGTDEVYPSESAGKSFSSEELSSEVLKTLKSFVRDEDVTSGVITVPARFRNNQIDATQKAAELAGFKYCELLQEPIAASIAYGVSTQSIDGYWLVFDFGGGTFDAALMKVEEGIMKVVDTQGDNHLGGKDIDDAIIDKIIIPYIKDNYQVSKLLTDNFGLKELRESLKEMAEESKIVISNPSKTSAVIETIKPLGDDDDGEEIEVDITMSLDDFDEAVSPIFQRAIDISNELLKTNNLTASDLEMVLLVGGPTLSQTLRRMMKEQLDTQVNTSIDPMTSVAVGAALYASSKTVPSNLQERDKQKIQLNLKYQGNTVEDTDDIGIRVDRKESLGSIPSKLFIVLSRTDGGWTSGRIELVDDAEILTVQLVIGKSNGFEINLYDEQGSPHPCEPSSFSIIQGFKEPSATLPRFLGLEAFGTGERPVVHEIPGLLKNQPLPAKGKDVFKTQQDIRPGNANDKIRLALFETDTPGSRAIHNHPAGSIVISGEDLPKFLPKGSNVEIRIEVDSSRRISLSAFFPDIDETVNRKIEYAPQADLASEELSREIKTSRALLSKLEDESPIIETSNARTMRQELADLSETLENGGSDFDSKAKVKERLRDVMIRLEDIEQKGQLPAAGEELRSAFDDLKIANERFGDQQTEADVDRFETLVETTISSRNLKAIQDLTQQISQLEFALVDKGAGVAMEISIIKEFDDTFDEKHWSNKNRAKQLLSDAIEMIASGPTKEKLRPLVGELFRLLPAPERPKLSEQDTEYLTK